MPQDFYNMSPKHFSLMLNGHNDHKLETYKLVRLLMFTMVRLHGDNKSGPKTPEQLWPLDGDEDTSIINEQEYREIFNRFKNGNEQRAVND